MKRMLASLLAAGLVLVSGASPAADDKAIAVALFSKPVVLRGTLGQAQIQMQLRPKEEFEGGVEGHYFAFGQSHQVLLAGEVEGDQLLMEESVNGTDVSGDWVGTLRDGVISGEWQGVRDDQPTPFRLEVLSPLESRKTGAAKKTGIPVKQ